MAASPSKVQPAERSRRSAGLVLRRFARLGFFVAITFVLPRAAGAQDAGLLIGAIVDSSGRPVGSAEVRVLGTGLYLVSDAAGRFRLAGIPAGTQRIRVEKKGFATMELSLAVVAGAPVRVDLVLAREAFVLSPMVVLGSKEERTELEHVIAGVPGAAFYLGPDQVAASRQANLTDVLGPVPGMYIQPKFGAADKAQISVRGSGLRNALELRGINLLVNGMPYRNADGFTDLESLELMTVDNIQVYSAGNAFRYGGSTLGGAINLQTKTGHTAEPLEVTASGGSYGYFKGQVASGATRGDFDYYASYTRSDIEGYRELSANRRDRVSLNGGWSPSPSLIVRGLYSYARIGEERPASLTRAEFEDDPTQADPRAPAARSGRDYTQHHAGLHLRTQLGAGATLEIAPYVQFRSIEVRVFNVIDLEERDGGVELRYASGGLLEGADSRFVLGLQGAVGANDVQYYANMGGERGGLNRDQIERAATLAVYAENRIPFTSRLSAVLGLRLDHARRALEDMRPDDGDQSDDEWTHALLPRVGLLYGIGGGGLFANASRLFEPPLLVELNDPTAAGFHPIEPQTAWQFEIGGRGQVDRLSWSISAYDIELRNEILNISVSPAPGLPPLAPSTRNSPRTRHYGLEAGLDYEIASASDEATGLSARVAYTYGRYEFVRDSTFDGNEMPGLPSHVVRAELQVRHPSGFALRPDIEWVPGDYFLDSENTERNDGWTVLGVRGEWSLRSPELTVFVEGRNLTDERYSPAVNADNPVGRYFLPADGRSVYAGVTWRY